MPGLDPFTPDHDYCVYCHAPAAGMCAECGALCCVDCVELVMGWTTRRATCRSCLERSEAPSTRPNHRSPAILWVIAVAVGAAAIAAILWLD